MSVTMPRLMLMACLLSVSSLWPSLSSALGLGEIHLYSALNEPMNAEIDLVAATPDELTALHATLAGRDAFARYGIDHPPFLSSLTFKVAKSKDGRDVLQVHSTDAIPEPFVTFLVEVNWARGRLMREYTILLDPPVYTPGENPNSTAPVTAPAVAGSPATAAPAPAGKPGPAAMPAPAGSAARHAASRGGVRRGSAAGGGGRRSLERGHHTCRERRYAFQNCPQLTCRYSGEHRPNDDRSVPFEPRCVRRQHQYIAQRVRAARSRCRRYSRPQSERGDERSSPANGCLAERRRCGGGADQRPFASGDAEHGGGRRIRPLVRRPRRMPKRRRCGIGSRIWKVSWRNRSV